MNTGTNRSFLGTALRVLGGIVLVVGLLVAAGYGVVTFWHDLTGKGDLEQQEAGRQAVLDCLQRESCSDQELMALVGQYYAAGETAGRAAGQAEALVAVEAAIRASRATGNPGVDSALEGLKAEAATAAFERAILIALGEVPVDELTSTEKLFQMALGAPTPAPSNPIPLGPP